MRHTGLPDKKFLQSLRCRQFGNATIGGLGAVEVEIFEFLQRSKLGEARIADLGVFEVKTLQIDHFHERVGTCVGDLAAGKIDPDKVLRDGGQDREFFVAKFVCGVDDAEAELLGILRQRHEGGVERLHLDGDLGDQLFLGIGECCGLWLLDLGRSGDFGQTFGQQHRESSLHFGSGLCGSHGGSV